jgi:hypothetical protein
LPPCLAPRRLSVMLCATTRPRLLSTRLPAPIAPPWSPPSGCKNAHRGLSGLCRSTSVPTHSQVSIASGETSRCCTKARRTPLLPQGNQDQNQQQNSQPENMPVVTINACVQDKIGSLGWALDSLAAQLGFDTSFQSDLTDGYADFENFALGAMPAGWWLAQPRVRSGTAAGQMIQGEVTGGRFGAYFGRALGGRAGMIPGIRAGVAIGRASSYATAIAGAFAGGYVAGAYASCAIAGN